MIGKLRYPVNIERFEQSQDPQTGEIIEGWALLARVWANIIGISGREFLAASAEQASTTYRATMRYRNDVDTTMRIQHGGKAYNIRAILPDDRQAYMTLMLELI